jgi:hypothetical protein
VNHQRYLDQPIRPKHASPRACRDILAGPRDARDCLAAELGERPRAPESKSIGRPDQQLSIATT